MLLRKIDTQSRRLVCATGFTGALIATAALAAEAAATVHSRPPSLIDIYQQAVASDPSLAAAQNANQAAQQLIAPGRVRYAARSNSFLVPSVIYCSRAAINC